MTQKARAIPTLVETCRVRYGGAIAYCGSSTLRGLSMSAEYLRRLQPGRPRATRGASRTKQHQHPAHDAAHNRAVRRQTNWLLPETLRRHNADNRLEPWCFRSNRFRPRSRQAMLKGDVL